MFEIDTSRYWGKAGDVIRVQAEDDMQVVRVRVAIYGARERVIEEGEAVSDRVGRWWTYTTQATGNGVSVEATAYDLSENECSLTIQRS